MEDERPADHGEVTANFCAVTGAAPHVAENYLGAHNWDLNTVRSLDRGEGRHQEARASRHRRMQRSSPPEPLLHSLEAGSHACRPWSAPALILILLVL